MTRAFSSRVVSSSAGCAIALLAVALVAAPARAQGGADPAPPGDPWAESETPAGTGADAQGDEAAPETPPPATPPPATPRPATLPPGTLPPAATAPPPPPRPAPATVHRETRAAPAMPAPRPRRPVPEHEEDDGRSADFLWLEVEGGISYVDLIALQNRSFTDPVSGASATAPTFVETRGTGPMIGAAGGFRLSFFALGVRGTFASYDSGFEIGTIGGEVHLRIPLPVVEPYIRVGAGYAWQGDANYSDPAASPATVYGWTVNGAVGLDIFVFWWLSLGIGGQVDFLNMTRQTDPTATCMGPTDFCPTQNGDALGVQGRAFGQLGLHF